MAGKARVHELAKELGVTSKDVLAKLNELGEFVKSASSTVEPPVARRLREAFPSEPPKKTGAAKKAPAKKRATKTAAKSTTKALVGSGRASDDGDPGPSDTDFQGYDEF